KRPPRGGGTGAGGGSPSRRGRLPAEVPHRIAVGISDGAGGRTEGVPADDGVPAGGPATLSRFGNPLGGADGRYVLADAARPEHAGRVGAAEHRKQSARGGDAGDDAGLQSHRKALRTPACGGCGALSMPAGRSGREYWK